MEITATHQDVAVILLRIQAIIRIRVVVLFRAAVRIQTAVRAADQPGRPDLWVQEDAPE